MFQENLKRLVAETDGGIAGLLMGFDGIAVDSYIAPSSPIDMNTIGMEFSFILGQVRKASEILEVGAVQEVAIRCDNLTIIMRVVSKDYFLALAVKPDGNFGKGRYLLRVVAPKMHGDLI
jgi:predicted regulator of Ras-like GTPase activity (Roadblock/LC7/MglB family)